MNDITAELFRLFVNRVDVYGQQQTTGGYTKIESPVTEKLIEMHLRGVMTIGTYLLDTKNNVKALCWDIDDHDKTGRDCLVIAKKIVQYLKEKYGIDAYIEASGSENSYHVWVFLHPTSASAVLVFGEAVLRELNLSDVEIFPKQPHVDKKGYGNLVKLPLGINRKSGKKSHFLNLDDLSKIEPSHLPACDDKNVKTSTQNGSSMLEQVMPNLRPCIQKAFQEKWQLNHDNGHYFRLSCARELFFHGASDATIHDFFKGQKDYEPKITQEKIESLKQNRKPVKCETLRRYGVEKVKELCSTCDFSPRKGEIPETETDKGEIPEHIKEKAGEIMRNGDVVKYIIDTHQKMHVGDVELAKSLLISIGVQSVRNSDGIHPKVSGDSGKGKTHCCKAMGHLMPKEFYEESELSDKAIYYMGLRASSVVFSDDVNLSQQLEGVIKRATTNFQGGSKYITLDTNRKKTELYIPPRITWWLTSVDDDQSLQLLNRTFGGGVDETPVQDGKVAQFQLLQAMNAAVSLPESDEVDVCREIIRQIKTQLFLVKIPFADGIIWNDKSNRRNLPIFLDIVKGFAVLRFRQRPVVDGFLLASIEDFEDAKALYREKAQNQGTKLTAIELKLLRTLHELRTKAGMDECDSTTLERCMKLTRGRIHQLLHGRKERHESGLLSKVRGLHSERKTIPLPDGAYATKTYYSLDDFDVLSSYGDVVELSENRRVEYYRYTEVLQQVNQYQYQTVTNNIDTSCQSVTSGYQTVTNNIDTSCQSVTSLPQKTKHTEKKSCTQLNSVSKENSLSCEKQKTGKNGNTLTTDNDNYGNSPFTSLVTVPTDDANRGNSGEKNIGKQSSDYGNSAIIKACKEWESNHQEKINSENLPKVCFALKSLFSDIMADDLADMIRKIAKITPTNSNSDKPPLKKDKEIEMSFNDWSLDRLKAGKKTATSRTKKYGNPGDVFKVGNVKYVLTAITEKPLKEIAEHYFKAEGAESSDEFIEVWRSIHRKKGFVPDQIVFYHEFATTSTNGNGNEDSDRKNPQHHCYVCGAIPAKNESISSMGVKKYYCNTCYYQKYPFFVDNPKGEL